MATGPWDDFAEAKSWEDFGSAIDAPVPKTGFARTQADRALALGQGITGGIKSLVDVAGTGTKASRTLGDISSGIEDLYSPARRAEKQSRQATIDEADASGGTIDQITSRLGGFAEAPAQTLLHGIGSMVPTVAAAVLSKGRTLAALPVGAAMGVGGVKGQNFDTVRNEALKQGRSEAEAEQLAARASEYSAENAPQQALGGALGALDAGLGVERLLGNVARGTVSPASRLRRVGIGAIEEAIPEGLQGAQGQYAQNLALTSAGFPTDPATGVLGSGILDATVGGVIGAGAGVPGRRRVPAPEDQQLTIDAPSVPPTVQPVTQAPGDPIRAAALPEVGPLTRGVNALVEAEAQAADIGQPVQTPVAAAIAGVPAEAGPRPEVGGAPAPAGEPTEPAIEKPTFDPDTGTIAAPQRATWPTREAVERHLSQQRVNGQGRTGKAAPIELQGGGFSFVLEGEPGYTEAAAAKKPSKLQERRETARKARETKNAQPDLQPVADVAAEPPDGGSVEPGRGSRVVGPLAADAGRGSEVAPATPVASGPAAEPVGAAGAPDGAVATAVPTIAPAPQNAQPEGRSVAPEGPAAAAVDFQPSEKLTGINPQGATIAGKFAGRTPDGRVKIKQPGGNTHYVPAASVQREVAKVSGGVAAHRNAASESAGRQDADGPPEQRTTPPSSKVKAAAPASEVSESGLAPAKQPEAAAPSPPKGEYETLRDEAKRLARMASTEMADTDPRRAPLLKAHEHIGGGDRDGGIAALRQAADASDRQGAAGMAASIRALIGDKKLSLRERRELAIAERKAQRPAPQPEKGKPDETATVPVARPAQADAQDAGKGAQEEVASAKKSLRERRAASQARRLDPERDTLLQAIAKLGGIRRADMAKEFAAEAADKAEQKRLADKEKSDREARDNKQRADQTIDDFELGQSAEKQLSGQKDIFDAGELSFSQSIDRGFNRAKAVANLPASVRDDPLFRPEKAEMRNVGARRALWDRLQAFGEAQEFQPFTLGVDSIGNITVGKRLGTAGLKQVASFADENDVGVYVLHQAAPQSADTISTYKDIGFEPTASLGGYGKSDTHSEPAAGGFATFVYKPRGISELLFSQANTPFFSALARQVEKAPMKQGDAAAWKGILKGWINSGAVKADEVEWTGLHEWLDLQPGKITRQAVGDFLQANGVQVSETVLGAPTERVNITKMEDALVAQAQALQAQGNDSHTVDMLIRGESAERVLRQSRNDKDMIPASFAEDIRSWHDAISGVEAPDKPKFGQYQLPGGTNYREVLLTLPAVPTSAGRALDSLKANISRRVGRATWTAQDMTDVEFDEYNRLNDESGRSAGRAPPEYRSGHWDQPNVIAHIRLDDRTDSEGRKVLFVEEVQGDWPQAMRKQQEAVGKAVDADFEGIVARMKAAGVLKVECD